MPRPVARIPLPPFSIEDFVVAYRHTKAELFGERSIPSTIALLKYEEDLLGNLKNLAERINGALSSHDFGWVKESSFIGDILQVPKGVSEKTDSKRRENEPHLYATDAITRWANFKEASNPEVSFRTMAVPSIDFQIVGMLWIMKVGHLLDQKLLPSCRGNRLKRASDNAAAQESSTGAALNNDSPQIFRPYHFAYRNWRRDGLMAIEAQIDSGNRVVAVTMDLRRYYHRIDPLFLLIPEFWTETFDIDLDFQQKSLTKLFTTALQAWAQKSPEKTGIPVGLLASRVIANALLHSFDSAISDRLNPIFYARYVDDLFLVLRPLSTSVDARKVIHSIKTRLGDLADVPDNGCTLRLTLPHTGNSILEFGASKQRIFDFQGASGKDLLNTVTREIDALSSEFRLMPDISEDDGSVLKHVLIADHDLEIGADSLRKADSLTIRRLGLAILLRNYDLLERCLEDPKEWAHIRRPFYDLIEQHVLTPERYSMYFQYLPRIFGLIAANGDWEAGERLLAKIEWVQSEIETLPENEPDKA